jgi:hypothetical protein
MANFLSFLWNGAAPPNATTTSSSTTSIPPYLQEYSKGVLSKADAISASPYQSYTGPRVTGFSNPTQQSFDMTTANTGNWQPALNQATATTQAATNPMLNNSAFQSYLSPYTSGVLDQIATRGGRNLSENLIPQINSTFTGSGQWGSSRNAQFMGNALRDTNEAVLNQQALALQQSYSDAMSNYNQGQNRSLQAGSQLGQLAQQQQQQSGQDAAALNAIGSQQEAKSQQNLDVAYQDFLAQRDYPKQQVDWMSNLVTGQPMNTTQNSTSAAPPSTYQPSPLSQITGIGSLLTGLLGKKRGGPIRRRGALSYA